MGAYLVDNPPKLSQFSNRSAKPSGLTVIHTAESILDTVGPDTGAESVAKFIQGRSNYGSYHDLVDSDSIINLVPYGKAAYHDGTGSNPHSLSISFACRTSDWRTMSAEKRRAFLRNGAEAFRRQQAWLKSQGAPLTQIRLITKADSDRKVPGIIGHGHRDPGRRTDPGTTSANPFPWDEFFTFCRAAVSGTSTEEDDMPLTDEDLTRIADRVWTRTAREGGAWAIHMLDGVDIKTGHIGAWVSQLLTQGGQGVAEVAEALRPLILDAVRQGMAADNADTADQIADRIAKKLAAPST